ncbi:hypothetical protein ACHAQA_003752 [Verticillium albo-atrum]
MPKYDPDAPPSYTEATTSSSANPSSSSTPPPPSISSHLATLTSRLRAAHRPAVDAHEIDLITLLIPDIEAHIAAFRAPPRRGAAPRRAGQLTLVPAAAVSPAWHPSEKPDHADELWQVARVRDVKGLLDSSSDDGDAAAATPAASREFDEWGRWEDDDGEGRAAAGWWWWRDEDLATRLAELLRPDARRCGTGPQGYEMKVTAEEVSFRRENEMGIWESMNGWGIVVRVTIRR